jgi:hypothetical protein
MTPLVLVYLPICAMSKNQFPQYFLPVVPALCTLAAVAIDSIAGAIRSKASVPPAGILASILTFGVVATTVPREVWTAFDDRRPDAESATASWIRDHFKPGTRIALDDPDLGLFPTKGSIERHIAEARKQGLTGRADYWTSLGRLLEHDHRSPRFDLAILYDYEPADGFLDRLERDNVRYFVRSGEVLERFRRSRQGSHSSQRLELYRQIEMTGRPIVTIGGNDHGPRGPAFQIFEINP